MWPFRHLKEVMKTLILNDVHVGINRKGGTTPASREALRTYLLESFQKTLDNSDADHLLIAGDLFDEFEVDPRDWVDTFYILSNWLRNGRDLTLMAGNHDWQPKAQKVSSFQMLCAVLSTIDGGTFRHININETAVIGDNRLIGIAHCANQDIFNARLDEVLGTAMAGATVVVHANYDNNFAAESDHSLNVSREVAKKFVDRGLKLLFAHEHQAKIGFKGSVVVMGNQWPTSIADCLGNTSKCLHFFENGDVLIGQDTWTMMGEAGFVECNWSQLDLPFVNTVKFVRVTGHATSNQASDVINAIARFRTQSDVFVVTNAVKVDGMAEISELPETFEAVKVFDVMEFIAQHLDQEEMQVVNQLKESL